MDQLVRALDALHAIRAQFFSGYVHGFLAEGRLRTAAFAEGLAAVEAGLALAETTLDRSYASELWRLKGELLLALSATPRHRPQRGSPTGEMTIATRNSGWPEAERCLLRALEMSRATQAKSLELRAATSLARAWQAHGRIDEARAALAEICNWFNASLASADLVEARVLLGELAPSLPRRARRKAGA